MRAFRFGLALTAAWGGLAAARAGGVADTAPAVPSQSFATALSPAQWEKVENCVDHGLAWLANGRWTRCTVTNGLASDDIGYLIEDEKNL